jgi:hypothetical protein
MVIVKRQLETLLHYKSVYWKKRFILNRIKYGDECTKFVHAMATVNYMRNAITQLKDDDGNMVQDHEGKAALLYNAYKNRMGISTQPQMGFDLSRLVTITVDLNDLAPILHEEIDRIIKLLPMEVLMASIC